MLSRLSGAMFISPTSFTTIAWSVSGLASCSTNQLPGGRPSRTLLSSFYVNGVCMKQSIFAAAKVPPRFPFSLPHGAKSANDHAWYEQRDENDIAKSFV
jgi:hypothetical protein